jgi:protein-tyrosine phosphatase
MTAGLLVDIHCHYLPGVDDGAADAAEALALLRAARDNGIGRVVLTPHIHPGRYANTRSSLLPGFRQFRDTARRAGIDTELALSAEVRISAELPALIERDEIPFMRSLRGERLLLLELPHGLVPPGTATLLSWLARRGIRTLLAHPERNKAIVHNIEKLRPLMEQGCLLQLTAASMLGALGPAVRASAEQLLRRGWVSVLATDAHNLRQRPPLLRQGAAAACAILGESKAWELVHTNPARDCAGLFGNPPEQAERRDAGGVKR